MRYDAMCPSCGSLERHRQLRLWLSRNAERVAGKRVLHFAPEAALAAVLRGLASDYKGADIEPGRADLTLNIEDLDLMGESFDLVMCSHVLEHVDDRKAISEIYRVLTPGGLAIFMFPIIEGWPRTLDEEDLPRPIGSTADRVLYFGQRDHVRYYGRDVRTRIAAAGFNLSESVAEEPDVSEYGLQRGETIFLATKPGTPAEPQASA
jgi:SAM-dependent methyltransferase